MTIEWSAFPPQTAVSGDEVVGLAGGTVNSRFPAESFLFKANNLSDVAVKATAFDNVSPCTTNGDIIYYNGTHNVRLGIGASGTVLLVAGGIPAWTANPAALKASNLSDVASPTISFNNIAPCTTNGDIIYYNGTNNVRLAAGATNTILSIVGGIPAYTATPTLTSLKLTPANALTAHVGGGQGSALQLSAAMNRITTVASAGDSVKLPAATAGSSIVVTNAAAANAMDVFPATGEAINALTGNTALSVAANKTVIFYCMVAGTWNSVVTA